jgi:glycosyltransferase involved in cell wall biosynthesis
VQLIYFHTYGGELNSGVNKKIFAQASQLFALGIHFTLVLVGGKNTSYPDYNFIHYISLNDSYFLKILMFKNLYRQYIAKQYLKKVMKFSEPGTILYLRYPLPLLLLPHELLSHKNCKIVIECNAIETHEQRISRSYGAYFKELIFGQEFRKRCDAIVGVTDEITHYQVQRSGNPNKPHTTIGNGFDVDSVPVRRPPRYGGSNLDILCIGTISFWHGIDRLIRGIAFYDGRVNISLHVIGNGAELPRLKKLSNDLGITGKIFFHGFVTGKDLEALFNQCHIAAGSLGMHRKGLKMTSELKCREYCSRGIPYIIACGDSDFPVEFPSILRLPPDESPIDMDQIITFTSRICQDEDHPQKMRLFASENLDWSVKMKRLKVFLEDLDKEAPAGI